MYEEAYAEWRNSISSWDEVEKAHGLWSCREENTKRLQALQNGVDISDDDNSSTSSTSGGGQDESTNTDQSGSECQGEAPTYNSPYSGLSILLTGPTGDESWHYNPQPTDNEKCWWHCGVNGARTEDKKGCTLKNASTKPIPKNIKLQCSPEVYSIGDQIQCQWSGQNVEHWSFVPEGNSLSDIVDGNPLYANLDAYTSLDENGYRTSGVFPSDITDFTVANAFDDMKIQVYGSQGKIEDGIQMASHAVTIRSNQRACDFGQDGVYNHKEKKMDPNTNIWYTCWDGCVYECTDGAACAAGNLYQCAS